MLVPLANQNRGNILNDSKLLGLLTVHFKSKICCVLIYFRTTSLTKYE